jgi:hypothetical protein
MSQTPNSLRNHGEVVVRESVESSPFQEVTVDYYVHMSPVFLNDMQRGINEYFGALVMKFVDAITLE